jgi:hypothetical protein
MSGPAKRRDHRREAYRRVVNLVNEFLRAPPQRASGDLCFLLTIDLHGCRQPGRWKYPPKPPTDNEAKVPPEMTKSARRLWGKILPLDKYPITRRLWP